jgi:hypothetical protein
VPNAPYMLVNGCYLIALAVWVGGMAAFALLFAPALTATLGHGGAGPVVSAFLVRFRVAVGVCILVLLAASAVKYLLWETLTGWLLARWTVLAAMTGLAAYDFQVLAPRLAAAQAAGDAAAFDRLHVTAARTMGATLALGLAALGLS